MSPGGTGLRKVPNRLVAKACEEFGNKTNITLSTYESNETAGMGCYYGETTILGIPAMVVIPAVDVTFKMLPDDAATLKSIMEVEPMMEDETRVTHTQEEPDRSRNMPQLSGRMLED